MLEYSRTAARMPATCGPTSSWFLTMLRLSSTGTKALGPYRRVVFLLASVDKLLADRGEIDSVTLREKKTLPKRPRTGV